MNVSKKLIQFSAYWYVEGNNKPTAKIGHIKRAERKGLDYFICSENQHGRFKNRINLNFDDLPSIPYIKNLTNFCKSTDQVYGKFDCRKKGTRSDAFLKLATIWTSKILFFPEILKHTDADYLMWVDCIRTPGKIRVMSATSDKCCITAYENQLGGVLFGGLIEPLQPGIRLAACVMKLSRSFVDEFVGKYIECLQFVDNNFLIYDEEIVLAIMNQKHPHLFELHR